MKKLYLMLAAILILCSACSGGTAPSQPNSTGNNRATSETSKVSASSSKELTEAQAQQWIEDWLEDYPLAGDLKPQLECNGISKDNNREYYAFVLSYNGNTFEDGTILVDKETAHLYFFDAIEHDIMYLDQWYGSIWLAKNQTFDRESYFTGITKADLLRYPDKQLGNRVYFYQHIVTDILEPRVYLVKNDSFLSTSGTEFLIIDDRNGNGANAFKGDRIAVYGTFDGNETVNFKDGRNEQVPVIVADRFIVNTIAPDSEDLAQALVAAFNNNEYTFGKGSKYIAGSTMQLVMGTAYGLGQAQYIVCLDTTKMSIAPESPKYFGNVDGYTVTIDPIVPEGIISPGEAGIAPNGGVISPIRVNCTIASVRQNSFGPYMIHVAVNVESYEAY